MDRPFVVSIAHQKGGVGKSTLAHNLAAHYARQGDTCAVVDADLQGTLTHLFDTFGEENRYGELELIRRSSITDYSALHDRRDLTLVVIDTPPYISSELSDIFAVSDVILIPTKPAINDFLAIDRTIAFAEQCRAENPGVIVAIVINMAVQGSSFTDQVRQELHDKGIKVLDTIIHQRVEFTRYPLYATSIFGSSDYRARQEVFFLGEEILSLLQ